MMTIGLIGGLSWESSAEYYRLINEGVHQRLGENHSAKLVMVSLDFHEIEVLQHRDRWEEAAAAMVAAARQVEQGGAGCLVICSNTMHRMADEVAAATSIPLLHIADATAAAVSAAGLKRLGLLGTRFTMEHDFYKGLLTDRYRLEIMIPDEDDRTKLHAIIFDQLVVGDIRPESRRAVLEMIERLVVRGAEGIILGCTEIPLLVKPGDASVPLFDTTALHAAMAVDWALLAE
ncbi:MAG: aspartate/glutamate racemase family protein [Fidelibacterota bacterium]|nr:MAG: aspartate/glutamate racemase family protein [Candidatus Neomarinimicrobiota bacterium]